MKTRLLSMLILMSMFCIDEAYSQDLLTKRYSFDFVKQSLIENQQWVSYPSYTDRAAWDELLGANKAMVIRRGESKLKYEWQTVKATDYLAYERTGNRKLMEDPHTANQNTLSDLVLAELAEGKGRFIDQIINGVFLQCERTSWVLSAHLPAQLSKRTLPESGDVVIDLGSARIAGLLAWTYYFLNEEFDKVNPEISKRLKKELYDKMITPYREQTRYWWMALNGKKNQLVNNWNPWCNFNALQCLFLLENDIDALAADVYKSMTSVDMFINYIKPDGACEEGPSYWGHAAGKLYDYLTILNLGTGGKVTLFNNPLIKNMGEYMSNTYIQNDWVVNFADASAKFSADAALIYRYGKAVNSDSMVGLSSELVRNGKNAISFGVDMFRALESLSNFNELKASKAVFTKASFIEYPETQFYYMHNKQLFFAAKGGHNNESHNHNDVGTFSLYYNNTPFIIDAGVGTYTRQTFGPERYSIWTMRSLYHNLPEINGFEQKNGANYMAKDVKFNGARKTLSLDMAGAYPENAGIASWVRAYKLNNKDLVIKDTFKLTDSKQANKVNFMLWGEVSLENDYALIRIENKTLKLKFDSRQLEASLEEVKLTDVRLTKVWGEVVYRLTLQAKSVVAAGEYQYKISIVE